MKTLKYLFAGFMVLGLVSMLSVAQAAVIMVPDPDNGINTIQDAINVAVAYDEIMVSPGTYAGAMVDKAVKIVGNGNNTIITSGPYEVGIYILPCANGAEISNLKINDLLFGVYSEGANDITVSHLTIVNPVYGIFNGGGSGWTITHNTISGFNQAAYGEGKGIYLYSTNEYGGTGLKSNLVAFNKVTANVDSGWAYFGIYADTPGFFCDPETDWNLVAPMENNKIVHNTLAVYGLLGPPDNPWEGFGETWWVIGLVIVDWRGYCQGSPAVITGNLIGFNDLRGSTAGMGSYPEALLTDPALNTVSRNLGTSRAIDFSNFTPPEGVWQFRPVK